MGASKSNALAKTTAQRGNTSGVAWEDLTGTSAGVGVDWSEADAEVVLAIIHRATKLGMAATFAAGAHGKTVSLGFLDGAERPRFTAVSPDDLFNLLARVLGGLPSP